MNILVINGPNLNLLGTREPKIYGEETLEELMMWLENSTEATNHKFKFYQSNHEGEIIDILHDGFINYGYHELIWNAEQNSSGVYFVKLISSENILTQKKVLKK